MTGPERTRGRSRARGEVGTGADPHKQSSAAIKPIKRPSNPHLEQQQLRREQVKKAYSIRCRDTACAKTQLRGERRRQSWHQLNDDLMLNDDSSVGSWGSWGETTYHSAHVGAYHGDVQKQTPARSAVNADGLVRRPNSRRQQSSRNIGSVNNVPALVPIQKHCTSAPQGPVTRSASLPTQASSCKCSVSSKFWGQSPRKRCGASKGQPTKLQLEFGDSSIAVSAVAAEQPDTSKKYLPWIKNLDQALMLLEKQGIGHVPDTQLQNHQGLQRSAENEQESSAAMLTEQHLTSPDKVFMHRLDYSKEHSGVEMWLRSIPPNPFLSAEEAPSDSNESVPSPSSVEQRKAMLADVAKFEVAHPDILSTHGQRNTSTGGDGSAYSQAMSGMSESVTCSSASSPVQARTKGARHLNERSFLDACTQTKPSLLQEAPHFQAAGWPALANQSKDGTLRLRTSCDNVRALHDSKLLEVHISIQDISTALLEDPEKMEQLKRLIEQQQASCEPAKVLQTGSTNNEHMMDVNMAKSQQGSDASEGAGMLGTIPAVSGNMARGDVSMGLSSPDGCTIASAPTLLDVPNPSEPIKLDGSSVLDISREMSHCSLSEPPSEGDIGLRGSPTPSAITVSTTSSDSSESEGHGVSARTVFGDTLAFDTGLGAATAVDAHEDLQEASCHHKAVSSVSCDDMDGTHDTPAEGNQISSPLDIADSCPASQGNSASISGASLSGGSFPCQAQSISDDSSASNPAAESPLPSIVRDDTSLSVECLLPATYSEANDEDLGKYLAPMQGQVQQVALPRIDFRELREQAAVTAEHVKRYCGRVLDVFLSHRPGTIFQHALTDETFQRLEEESQHELGGLLRQAAFDSLNCVLTSLYTTSNRMQNNSNQLRWKSAPLPKQLPDDSILRETAIKAVVDGIQYQLGAVGGHDTDQEAVWYSEKVASEHDADMARTQQHIAAHSAAEFLEESSLECAFVMETIQEELVQDVVNMVLSIDQQHVMRMDPQDVFGAANGDTEQDAGHAVLEGAEAAAQHADQSTRNVDDMDGNCVLAMNPSGDTVVTVEAVEEESHSSRRGYECRREYSVAFCAQALDSFLEDMPEELQQGKLILGTQVFEHSTQASGLQYTGETALHTQMLERMLLDVYGKYNRAQADSMPTYVPQPLHRRLPNTEQLKTDMLEEVSCMHNPPWEPPNRKDGEDVAWQVHRNHVTKHMAACLESCRQYGQRTAITDSSVSLIAVCDDLFHMMVMDTAAAVRGVDRTAGEQQ